MQWKFFTSLKNAFKGIHAAFQIGNNIRTQVFLGLFALILAILLHLDILKISIILILIGTIIAFEIFNTSIEKLCDHLHPNYHSQIALVKDLAAGAVLWMSLIASIIGILIFIPPLIALIKEFL